MKWLREILRGKRKANEEKVSNFANTLGRMLRELPLDDTSQAARILYALANNSVVMKTDDIISLDTKEATIQSSLLFSTADINALYGMYKASYEHYPFVKFTMEAERTFISKVIMRLKDYCTAADNAGSDMLLFTGADISSIWTCLDMAKDFIAYRAVFGDGGAYNEIIQFMNTIVEFSGEERTVVLMNGKIMLSNPTLDVVINEMTRHYYIKGMGEMMEKYNNVEWRYFDDEGNNEKDCCHGEGRRIRVTEG